VAGLIAVLGQPPGGRSAAEELRALVRCYRLLRGQQLRCEELTAGPLGVAALLLRADGGGGRLERRGDSWAAQVGRVHGAAGAALERAPQALDGQFALIRYEQGTGRLELLSDPFAMQALYVAERDGVRYACTSALALAWYLGARPSALGIEAFLRSGPHFGPLTSWEGIRRLEPATLLVHDRGGVHPPVSYWRPALDQRLARSSLQTTVAECVERLSAAMAAGFGSLPEPWCDLTGGFDTRLGSLLLRRAGVSFHAETVGEPDHEDVQIARRVAASAGFPWERQPVPGCVVEHWRQAVSLALGWGDGVLEVAQLAEVLAGHRQRGQLRRSLLASGGGEHWRNYAWQQEGLSGGRRHGANLERWASVRLLHPIAMAPLRAGITERVRESLLERARAHLAPHPGELGSVALDRLHAYKSMGHHGAYLSAARGALDAELPFYTKTAFSAALSSAPAHRRFGRLARSMLWSLDPKVARLPTSSGGPGEPIRLAALPRFAPYAQRRARAGARKLTQNLPGPTLGRLPAGFRPDGVALRERLLGELRERTGLDPARMRAGSLYDRDGLRALAASPEALAGGWTTLGRIITVELALERVDACLP
jgi:hypothetical protein